jgi:hypothetical protein
VIVECCHTVHLPEAIRGFDHHVFVAVIARQQSENAVKNSALRPPAEALVDDLPIAETLWKIPPRDAGPKSIQNRFDEDQCGLNCDRADNIWKESAVIQDIFGLIYRSYIVVCDFTGKNPNVFYEAGIAHTLGKHVIPITQHADDIPFDLRQGRSDQTSSCSLANWLPLSRLIAIHIKIIQIWVTGHTSIDTLVI